MTTIQFAESMVRSLNNMMKMHYSQDMLEQSMLLLGTLPKPQMAEGQKQVEQLTTLNLPEKEYWRELQKLYKRLYKEAYGTEL